MQEIEGLNFEENLKEIIDSNFLKKICEITKDSLEENIITQIDNYIIDNRIDIHESNDKQSGRVWILVGWENEEPNPVSLQVGQSLNIFKEIKRNVNSIFDPNAKIKLYRELRKIYHYLVFYELSIDEYLRKYAREDLKELIYEIAKEYYAEALLAHNTYSRNWGFYNSGMDKRAYFTILNDYKSSKL